MASSIKITKEELERLYLQEHLSMDEIGKRYGMSRLGKDGVTRQFIWKLIHRYGIDKHNAERFLVICDYCKNSYETLRCNFCKSKKHYCSRKCYMSHKRQVSTYKESSQGRRAARRIMEKSVGRELLPQEVTHHIDGDCENNITSNLYLFPSQSEHMKHHHQIRINANVR